MYKYSLNNLKKGQQKALPLPHNSLSAVIITTAT
jgi:hypothetical protein|tara:strand:+ start:10936 stop:11037 length:102 start_codon:yes stop_codon:yes gene_type:complete